MNKAVSVNFLLTVIIIIIFTIIIGLVSSNIFQEFVNRKCLNDNANKLSKLLEVAEEVKSGTKPDPYYYSLKIDWCVKCVSSIEKEATDCNVLAVPSSIDPTTGTVFGILHCFTNIGDCGWNIGKQALDCKLCCCQLLSFEPACVGLAGLESAAVCQMYSLIAYRCKYDAMATEQCKSCLSGVANSVLVRVNDKIKFVNFYWDEEEKKCDISGSKTYRIRISLEDDFIKIENLGEIG